MILITFDDAVNQPVYERINLIRDHQNPDGSPVAFTFYVSTENCNFWQIHELHAAGHEIAAHTVTHTTSRHTSLETWVREIDGCREILHRLAGIPLEDIRGFRAPYLGYNADTFEALSLLGFNYDSSVTEAPGIHSLDNANYIWPYTLHNSIQQNTWTGDPPTKPYPDLFQVPMWMLLGENNTSHNMDPSGSREELLELFQSNLLARYHGNRAPMGIWLHASQWLPNDDNVSAMNDFLEWALQMPDVWVVGTSSLVDWMKNPVSAEQALVDGTLTRPSMTPIPQSDAYSVSFSNGTIVAVNRPLAYPTASSIFTESLSVDNVILELIPTNVWQASFQAEIHVTHTSPTPLSGWSIRLDIGEATLLGGWDNAAVNLQEDGSVLLTPNWYGTDLPTGGFHLATVSIAGQPEDIAGLSGNFLTNRMPKPNIILQRDNDPGQLRLKWDRTASIFDIEFSSTLAADDWTVIDRVYGLTEKVLPINGEKGFYRIRPSY